MISSLGCSTRGTLATSARRVQRKRASSQCPVKGTGLRATGSTQRLLEAIRVYYRNGDHCYPEIAGGDQQLGWGSHAQYPGPPRMEVGLGCC